MGWSYGHNSDGREIGYSVAATCDDPVCGAEIDRGLAYACGGMHDEDEWSCAGYFCYKHLTYSDHPGPRGEVCKKCHALLEKLLKEQEDENRCNTGENP